MLNLEQVKLLETKVVKLVDYLDRLSTENAALHQKETELQAKLESDEKRIEELEVLVMNFKEDQGQIEEGILAMLDRLNQFEKAIDKSLREKKTAAAKTAPAKAAEPSAKKSLLIRATEDAPASTDATTLLDVAEDAPVAGDQTCFEIPAADTAAVATDVTDPLGNTANVETAPAQNQELDIF